TLRQEAADRPVEIDAVLPARLAEAMATGAPPPETGRPFRPWAIRLRRERPLSFQLTDSAVTVLVHTASIESGDDAFRGWDLIVTYRPVREGGRWYAELQGGIDVLPTSFDPGRPGAKLPSRQRALRRNLAQQLSARTTQDANFPRRVEIKPVDLTRLGKAGLGELAARSIAAGDGWLSLSFMAR
ncbi:MAG: hypothetical protein AAF790_10250, partial [Planctomycetota bacterium]